VISATLEASSTGAPDWPDRSHFSEFDRAIKQALAGDARERLAPTRKIDPATIHTRIEGDGERTFLLLNGAGQSLRTWNFVVPALLDLGRVVRLDVPGVGESPPPETPYSFEELADAVLEVARSHVTGPLIVVGHAWGGRAAQVIARDHGDEIAGVVIGANGGKFPPLQTPEEMQTLSEAAANDDLEAHAAAFERVMCASGFFARDPERAHWLLDVVRGTSADRDLVRAAAQATPPESYWGQFSTPALLLYGAEDRIGHRANAEDLHAALADSKLVYIDQAGHFVIAEKAERFASEIATWIEQRGL
jgi:pimeloyl-ACP methyl ester carboxylesterase